MEQPLVFEKYMFIGNTKWTHKYWTVGKYYKVFELSNSYLFPHEFGVWIADDETPENTTDVDLTHFISIKEFNMNFSGKW